MYIVIYLYIFSGVFWVVISRHKQASSVQIWHWKGQNSEHLMWQNRREGRKSRLGSPGLGSSCLPREHPRAGSQQLGGSLAQVTLFSAETAGEGSQGWISPVLGCTESLKQGETQGESFFQSPAEFALTLPHLVGGREGSGYY